MESQAIKLSYLVLAIDHNKAVANTKILLDDNKSVLSTFTDKNFIADELLIDLHNQYINYHFDYIPRLIGGVRKVNGIVEIIFYSVFNYIPGFNKIGRVCIYNEIVLEDYYVGIVNRAGFFIN